MTQKEEDPVSRTKAKLERNERMLERLRAMDAGKTRAYGDLTEIADVLSLRPDPPTQEQLRQIKDMLVEQQEAISRLLAIVERLLPESLPEE